MAEMVKNWRDDRRNAILDVAHRSFLENGYAATSMSSIAAKLGGSKTTLYNYFPSKDDLFVAVAKAQCARVMSRLYGANDYTGGVQTVLTTFCTRFLGEIFHRESVEFLRMVIAQSPQFPEIGKTFYRECIDQGVVQAESFLRKMVDDGRLSVENPHRAASFLLSLCSGVLNLRHLLCVEDPLGDPQNIRIYAEDIVWHFLKAYGPDSAGQLSGD